MPKRLRVDISFYPDATDQDRINLANKIKTMLKKVGVGWRMIKSDKL